MSNLELRQVEAALREDASVADCVVLERKTVSLRKELVAYIISSGSFKPERLTTTLKPLLPPELRPNAYVAVSSLPLTRDGKIDEEALTCLEVIDSDLVKQWEAQLLSVPEIDQAAVVADKYAEKLSPLHLSDLLPDWGEKPQSEIKELNAGPAPSDGGRDEMESKPLAISNGGPLREIPNILSEALQQAAAQKSEKYLVYIQLDGSEIVQSYSALLKDAERILAGLRKLGLKPQDKVIFQLDLSQDFIPAYWACILGGFIPAPVSIATSYETNNPVLKKLHGAWQMLAKPIILAGAELAPSVRSLSALLNLEDFRVEILDDLRKNAADHNWHAGKPDDLALLLFTSGSTGVPKGVMLTHRNLLSMAAGTAQMFDFTSEEVTLNWMPLDHVGGVSFLHTMAVYCGCNQVQAPTQVALQEPFKWLDWLDKHRVTITWAPNFAFSLFTEFPEEVEQGNWDLSAMRFLVNAGELVVPKIMKRFIELFTPHKLAPDALHPAFGMSETCSGITWSLGLSLESIADITKFVDLGPPIPGATLRMVDENNQPVKEGIIGRLQLTGPSVTPGYFKNPAENQKVFTQDGWFDTGDLGFLENGLLTLTGREKDEIIINGINYHNHEIESAVQDIEGIDVSYTAACAVRDGSDDEKLAIFFCTHFPDDENRLMVQLKQIRARVARDIGVKAEYLIPVEKKDIPKTAIGKIQRPELKKRFEAGEFDAVIKRIDILTGNANTLPDWFFRKIWRRKEGVDSGLLYGKGPALVFLDQLGLGKAICPELNKKSISVEIGSNFEKIDSNKYRINPKTHEHYRLLFESLREDKIRIDQIIHLWTYDGAVEEMSSVEMLEKAQELGVYSLLFLIQSLVEVQGSEHSVRLLYVSNHTQPVLEEDEIAYEKSTVMGLIKTIFRELPWINCRHVDLQPGAVEVSTAHILREMRVQEPDFEIAYRDGHRFISRLEKINPGQKKQQDLPFKQGGMYLISGGLGGIGVEIAKYLLQNYQACLLLVGRTSLPERNTWEKKQKEEGLVAERVKAFLELQRNGGGKIIYQAGDISDLDFLRKVVDQAESKLKCELDGVVHLAGIGKECLLTKETRDSFALSLHAKVLGTWTLHELLKDRPNSIFISFSSVTGFFGGSTFGAYAAACSFQDTFSHYLRRTNSVKSYCIAWSQWSQVGMSKQYPWMENSARAVGFRSLAVEAGLHSLSVSLLSDEPHLFVGLDGQNPHIQRYTEMTSPVTQRLCGFFTTQKNCDLSSKVASLKVLDRFGVASTCDLIPIEKMPLLADGNVDLSALARPDTNGALLERSIVPPQNELEQKLVEIWEEILNITPISVEDNFFELGGSSLQAVRIFAKIEKTFEKKMSLATPFQAPTIRQLADIIQQEGWSPSWSSLVAIQPDGSKPPFFCMAPLASTVLIFANLARQLGKEQPFYGLEPLGLDGEKEPHDRVEDMAAHYIKEIRMFKPEGPYFVGGGCFGGTIAFEVAQQLVASGEQVVLVILDTIWPPLTAEMIKNPPENYPFMAERFEGVENRNSLSYDFRSLMRVKLRELPSAVKKVILKRFKQSYREERIERITFTGNYKPSHIQHVMDAHYKARLSYVTKIYPGRIILLQSPLGATRESHLAWSELATGGVDCHMVPGDHELLYEAPNVQVVAAKLRACLDEAQAELNGSTLNVEKLENSVRKAPISQKHLNDSLKR